MTPEEWQVRRCQAESGLTEQVSKSLGKVQVREGEKDKEVRLTEGEGAGMGSALL